MEGDISIIALILLASLLIPIIVIAHFLKFKLTSKIVISFSRMFLQLSLVGFYLKYIFKFNNQFLNFAYITMMTIIACISVITSSPLKIKDYFFPIFISFYFPLVIVLTFFNTIIVNLSNPFDARYFITIGGMLLGNSLKGIIIAINTLYDNLKTKYKEYLYILSLSANRLEALKPYIVDALRKSVLPILASIETIGLVALPGMMTGQILGGSLPFKAVKYQIAIMIAIFIVMFFSSLIAVFISLKKMLNRFDVPRLN